MDPTWKSQFEPRLEKFTASQFDGIPISIKVRPVRGCFHREHSPEAYRVIDAYLLQQADELQEIRFEEHDSGPELLFWVAAGSAAPTVIAAVINLVAAVIKAQHGSTGPGHRPQAALQIIIRRLDDRDRRERLAATVEHDHPISRTTIRNILLKVISELPSDPN